MSRAAPQSAVLLERGWENYHSWTFNRPQNAPIVIALYDDADHQIQPCLQLQKNQLENTNADHYGLAVASNTEDKVAAFYPFLMNCVQGEQCPHLYNSAACSQTAMQEVDAGHHTEDQVRFLAHAFVYLRKTQAEAIQDELDKYRLDPTDEVFDGYVKPPRIDPDAHCWVFDFDLTLSRLPNFGFFGKKEDAMIETEDAALDAYSLWRESCIRQLLRHYSAGGALFSDYLKDRFAQIKANWERAECSADSYACAMDYFRYEVFTPENVMTLLIGGRKHMQVFKASMMKAVVKHNFGSKGPWVYILTDNGNYKIMDAFYDVLFGEVVTAIHEKNGTGSLPSAHNQVRTFSKYMASNIPPLYNLSKVDFIQNVISHAMAATMVENGTPVSARPFWLNDQTQKYAPALEPPLPILSY